MEKEIFDICSVEEEGGRYWLIKTRKLMMALPFLSYSI